MASRRSGLERRVSDPLRSSAPAAEPLAPSPPLTNANGTSRPSYLTPNSSRANSLDRARAHAGSPHSQVTSLTGSNPFRDPSLDWVRGTSFENDAHSILSSPASDLASPYHEQAAAAAPVRPSPGERRPSEVQRDLRSAVGEEMPRISEDSPPPREYVPTPPANPRSKSSPSTSGGPEKKRGLLYQFRTGSGWFAPLVEPEQPMTRDQRAEAERARIEKLKDGRPSSSARRPGLMKRMSSGVEMGFKGRDRSGSASTITNNGQNR
ncbi:hypothetical protein JCM8202_004267 [Rhodotorula sphaerocarpa]